MIFAAVRSIAAVVGTAAAALVGALSDPHLAGPAPAGAYAGVACPVPNSIACDRIGLAVRLHSHPQRVHAVIGGRTIALAPHGTGSIQWVGYLYGAGLRGDGPLVVDAPPGSSWWGGEDPPVVLARVVSTFADGRQEVTAVATPLRPGWG